MNQEEILRHPNFSTHSGLSNQWVRRAANTTLSLLAMIAVGSVSSSAFGFQLVLDPGHGGIDAGAVRGQVKESDITLAVTKQLSALLKESGFSNLKVALTRESDQTLSLDRRVEISKNYQADLFVSIHLNSSTDGRAHGKEFYFQNQLPADEEALFLASKENGDADSLGSGKTISKKQGPSSDLKLILDDLKRNHRIHTSGELSKLLFENWIANGQGFPIGTRAIRQAPFRVLTLNESPAILIELGFLSHPVEGPMLSTPEYQQKLAKSLKEGLLKYIAQREQEVAPLKQ